MLVLYCVAMLVLLRRVADVGGVALCVLLLMWGVLHYVCCSVLLLTLGCAGFELHVLHCWCYCVKLLM